jgi:hypothetical protein
MANDLLTPDVIAKEALMQLDNNLVMGASVHREYKKEFKKVGETISIRKPVKFEVTDGADVTNHLQDITEQSTTLTIDHHKNVAFPLSASDLALKVEEYSKRYITPAMTSLANQIDLDLHACYKKVWAASGTAASTPAAFATLGSCAQLMDDMAIPSHGRKLVCNPACNWSLADALKGSFDMTIAKDTVRAGFLGRVAGMEINSVQGVRRHTAGTATGILVDAVGGVTYVTASDKAATSTLYVDTGTGTLTVGDVITIADVYSVNPITRETTEHLQQFTVVTATTLDGTDDPVTVSPAIRTTGAYQTVNSVPADGAQVTLVASHTANLAFVRNAFALVTIPIEEIGQFGGVKMKTIDHNGLAITVTTGVDILTLKAVIRLDIMYAADAIYPDLAVRLLG